MQRWVKFGEIQELILIGKDVVATASGIYVIFFHLATREERIERFDNKERGDGATCLAGHPAVSMFCVAEKRSNPKISSFTYPAMRKISSCVNEDNFNGYLSCAFAGTDHLLSLTSFPNFNLIVWFWRSGEKATIINTTLNDPAQSIICSPNAPHCVAQFGKSTGRLVVYQLYVCSRIISLTQIELKPFQYKISSLSWTQDSNLILCDEFGNIYLAVTDENKQYCIVRSISQEKLSNGHSLVSHQNGVIIGGIGKEIRFYRKSSTDANNLWQLVWTISSKSQPIKMIKNHLRNSILYHNEEGEITEVSISSEIKPVSKLLYNSRIYFKEICAISSWRNSFIGIDKFDKLHIFNILSGQSIKTCDVRHHGEVCQIKAHSVLPLVVISGKTGNCLFIDAAVEDDIKILKCFHLHGETLDKIKFSHDGEFMGISNSQGGCVFLVEMNINKIVKIRGLLEIHHKIADFLIYYQRENELKVLILITTIIEINAGNKILVYDCKLKENNMMDDKIAYEVELLSYFTSLNYGSKNLRAIGVPCLSKQLHTLELEQDFHNIRLIDAIGTMHQLRNIEINISNNYCITSGYDGLVILRDASDCSKLLSLFIICHRSQGGIKNSIIVEDTLLSLGRNGDLIATVLTRLARNTNKLENEIWSKVKIRELKFDSFDADERIKGITWLERMTFLKELEETEKSTPVCQSIRRKLQEIKKQVKELIDSNEEESPETCLSISSFDLDIERRKRILNSAKIDREEYQRNLGEIILNQDRVSSYIQDKFWEPLLVPSSFLLSMSGETRVSNFLLADVKRDKENITVEAKEEVYEKHDALKVDDTERRISSSKSDVKKFLELEEILRKAMQDENEELCLSGTTTYKWIEDDQLYLTHQLSELVGVKVTEAQREAIIRERERKLKIHFNRLFEGMRSLKEKELSKAKQLIGRLRHCASELKRMFDVDWPVGQIEPPVWHFSEIPDSVVTIKDEEVATRPYLSSEEEEEGIANGSSEMKRTNSLDDFYASALEKMMDGILQVRWEDEIKKDIPRPRCLLASRTSKFTEDDLREIQLYEEKVERLNEERFKYKNMLMKEMEDTEDLLKRTLRDFDANLKSFGVTRIKLESAVFQEKLSRARMLRQRSRIQATRERISRVLEEESCTVNVESRELAEKVSSMESAINELKARYESLSKREKLLEGKFQAEFSDLKETSVEHLFRHYKKRSKMCGITCTSVAFLAEMGKCVMDREKSRDTLPRECLDFLASVDGLDAMPASLPSQIGFIHWRAMCKLRRVKVEMEIKVKSCAVELAEAEQTLSAYQKLILVNQKRAGKCRDAAESLKKSLARLMRNRELQLILKNGQIEISLLSGDTTDFQNSILISRDELARTNREILSAGHRKLSAMHRNVAFRKKIDHKEWQYDCERLRLEILREESKNLRDVKITKEVQEYLKQYPNIADNEEHYKKVQENIEAFEDKFERDLEKRRNSLRAITGQIEHFKRKNEKLDKEIELMKLENLKLSSQLRDDGSREKEEEFRKNRIETIARRTELVAMVQSNYDELLALHAQLELLKLRTYPTLKFKAMRGPKRRRSD